MTTKTLSLLAQYNYPAAIAELNNLLTTLDYSNPKSDLNKVYIDSA